MRINLAGDRKSKKVDKIEKKEGLTLDISEKVKTKYLIAKEEKKVNEGCSKPIRIEEITIPPNHLCVISGYARHRLGHVISVGENHPKPIELQRTIDNTLFAAGEEGKVKENDLIGIIFLFKVKKQ